MIKRPHGLYQRDAETDHAAAAAAEISAETPRKRNWVRRMDRRTKQDDEMTLGGFDYEEIRH